MPRYRAPQENGGVLADPPMAAWPRLVEENRRRLNAATVKIDGVPLNKFRAASRQAVTSLSPRFVDTPLIVTGHQPELSHPGVWVKNFAANGLARKVGGFGLNLVVDNDTLKVPAIHIPVVSPRPGDVRLATVPFDTVGPEEPYETRLLHDPVLFATFRQRLLAATDGWGFTPLAGHITFPEPVDQPVGDKFVVARRLVERDWGCSNADSLVSQLSGSPSFLRFAQHIAADADRFRAVYNHAVQSYRRAHRIRSRNHPVPDLAEGELPFWGPMANGRRTRVTEIVPGIRPRALTLTLFVRLCVADFFLHGIGGGQYDEVTDTIIRDYFGIDPPRYAVLSATLHLPLKAFPGTMDDVHRYERQVRDLHWNPHRHLPADSREVMRHRIMETTMTPTRAGRRHLYRSFRMLSEELRPRFVAEIDAAKATLADVWRHVAANAILQRRDYSWVLYPEETLRPFLTQFLK